MAPREDIVSGAPAGLVRDAMETLIDLLETAVAAHGDETALSIRAGLREDAWSYRRLWRAANAGACHLLEDVGLQPGDRVVVWGPNCPQLVAAYYGVMLARLILVPIDPYSSGEFLERVAERTEAAAVVAGFQLPERAGGQALRLDDFPFDAECPFTGRRPAADDIAEIVFTSGTTGSPKGVILTHANIIANVLSAKDVLRVDPRHVLSILPLSHMLEQTAGLYLPLTYGGTIHYLTSRQSPVVMKALRRYGIVVMVVVPQVLTLLLEGIEREARRGGRTRQWRRAHRLAPRLPMGMRRVLFRDVHRELGGHLELFFCGGAYLAPDVASAWERMGVTTLEGYGTTECAPVVATNTSTTRRHGSVGRPLPGVEVRLSDEGEILVRGANVTQGYWRDEQATPAAFTEDGWYRTGDIAEVDEDGFLYLRGRLKDVIVLANGMKVYPEDVERELGREDGVEDCVVLGMLDPAGNAHVHALVIATAADEDGEARRERVSRAVRNANDRLAPHQRISGFTLWEGGDFPRTNLLKVKRHEALTVLSGEEPAPVPRTPAPSAGEERLARLRHLLADLGGVSIDAITPDSDLTLDLNLDSLSRVELAVLLEGELGVSVEDGDLAVAGTVAQLYDLVERGETVSPPPVFPGWSLRAPARIARALLQALLVFPAHALVCRPFRVEGSDHLRDVRLPVLLIANHTSHVDTPSILRALPRRVRGRVAVAAAADYFYRTRPRGLAMTLLLNAFPFSREGAVRSSLEYCGELVDRGWSILVYPEGTRSPTGKLQPFRSGIGLLATELRIPVVPVAVEGGHEILAKGSSRPQPGSVVVRFGPAISPAPSDNYLDTATRLERAVADLMTFRDEARAA